jgi:hypothetical protein
MQCSGCAPSVEAKPETTNQPVQRAVGCCKSCLKMILRVHLVAMIGWDEMR